MKTSFKYRLYPSQGQETIMKATREECRWLYNHFLEQRKNAWEHDQQSISMYDQIKTLPRLKQERSSLNVVHSQVLQDVAIRIDLAFEAFFRRKADEKPGYPRFRGAGRYDSFTYTQSGFAIVDDRLRLSKIGDIKIKLHRPIIGDVKTLTIRKTATNKWYAGFSCEIEAQTLPESNETVGIDVGLETFATMSTGEKVDNPQFFRVDERALAKAQRKVSKKETPEDKYQKVVAHIYERIANRRSDFSHKLSRSIVNRFGIIAIEDLSINRMVHNHCLAKSIADAAWGQFAVCLAYKAENAGRQYIAVNPAYTSQDCSRCGHRQPMPLSEREFNCPCCGLVLNRDHNASLNILAIGLDSLGLVPRSPCFLDMGAATEPTIERRRRIPLS